MFVGLLGPTLVLDDRGASVTVSAQLQRGVLAILASRANQLVLRDELAELLWDGRMPNTSSATLITYISRLRTVLGRPLGGRLVTRPTGYLLEVSEAECDLLRFAALERDARRSSDGGDWERAGTLAAEALGLWRGEPFVDCGVLALQRTVQPTLEMTHVALEELLVTADLRARRTADAVAGLQRLIARHPLRERPYEQLMTALHRDGRRAEALAVYRDARTVLQQELGLDPGPGLARVLQEVLAAPVDAGTAGVPAPADAAPSDAASAASAASAPGSAQALIPHQRSALADRAAVPRQLPAAPRFFVARESEADELGRALGSGDAQIVALVGVGGVGKTSLALAWAQRVIGDYPDGQLYVNLRGFDPGGRPLPPRDALGGFLYALGVPAQRMPEQTADRAALYRTLVSDKRLLVVLDNAADSAHVRDLLPGGRACHTVVTSRDRLVGLIAAEGAVPVRLGPLSEADALSLLIGRPGRGQADLDGPAAGELVRHCGGLPLALAVLAARLAVDPGLRAADLVRRLDDETGRLAELGTADATTDVRAVFSWSYQNLSPQAAGLFRYLGLHSGPTISLPSAASLAGLPVPVTHAALNELSDAHLLETAGPESWQFHDLLRLYAAELAAEPAAEELGDTGAHDKSGLSGESGVSAARLRMLDHYLHSTFNATTMVHPYRPAIELNPVAPGVTVLDFDDAGQAQAWIQRELAAVAAACAVADAHGFDAHAWRLPWTLMLFLNSRGEWRMLTDLALQAVDAAGRFGDDHARAWALCDAGLGFWRIGDPDAALAHLAEARAIWRTRGDLRNLARVERTATLVCESLGRLSDELGHARAALDLARRAGDRDGEARGHAAVSWVLARVGDYESAREHARFGLDCYRELGNPTGEGDTLDTLGLIAFLQGRWSEALDYFQRSVAAYIQSGDRFRQMRELVRVSTLHETLRDEAAAARSLREAEVMMAELGIDRDEVVGEVLATMTR